MSNTIKPTAIKAPPKEELPSNRAYYNQDNATKFIGVFMKMINASVKEDMMIPYSPGIKPRTMYLKVVDALKFCVNHLDTDQKFALFRASVSLRQETQGITIRWKPGAIFNMEIASAPDIVKATTQTESIIAQVTTFVSTPIIDNVDELDIKVTLDTTQVDEIRDICNKYGADMVYFNENLRIVKS